MGRLRIPAEAGPHEGTIMAWPCRDQIYPGSLMAEARDGFAAVASTIASFEPVWMVAHPDHAADAAARCGPGVEVVEIPIDDSWFRDNGPIYVFDGDERVALDFEFNAWGNQYWPYDLDDAAARAWANLAGHRSQRIDFVFEGGSLQVDGAGTGVSTLQCLMHPNRNPDLTFTEIEDQLCDAFGLDALVWLPYGLALDRGTDGHVDNVAAFAEPGTLIVQGCDDPDEPDHHRLDANRRTAQGLPDADGARIEAVEVPILPFVEREGRRFAVPYVNFYVGNGFVLVPTCGHPADDDVVASIGSHFPGRRAIGLDVGSILAVGGGGIHCITQQVPAARA